MIELIDDENVLDALTDEARQHWHKLGGALLNPSSDPDTLILREQMMKESNTRFGDEQAEKAKTNLKEAIQSARSIEASSQLAFIMNLRDKHLAHSLSETRREAKHGPISPMKYGYETNLLDASISILEKLYCWVAGKSFSIADSQKIDRKNAEALWNGCTIKVLR